MAFVTKYRASVDILSVSGELFMIILTRACGSIMEPSPNFGLNDDILLRFFTNTSTSSPTLLLFRLKQ